MADDGEHLYLLPLANITISREWPVGNVTILPAGTTRRLIDEHRVTRKHAPPDWYDSAVDERTGAQLDQSTVAKVLGGEPRAAYEHVADALAILRLLQHVQVPTVDTDLQTFGLPGQVAQWHVEFIDLLAGPGQGFIRGGAVPGWTLSNDDYAAFHADVGLQFLSRALANSDRSRLEQRGLLGVRLLSSSTLEQDPDQKLLAAVMALEVLIGDDVRGAKKFRLARRNSYLACGVPQSSMCGRDRPSCPYLALDPDIKTDAQQLEGLRKRAEDGDVRVICSEYYRIIELYDARSRAVHDGTVGVDLRTIRDALYPVYRWLIPEVFKWYARTPRTKSYANSTMRSVKRQ